ncbi:MAG: hypothetical protein QM528_07125 [Phycisphaerales bacterium]|nr:hypothetical protein [Phycisphaerales bacterium]
MKQKSLNLGFSLTRDDIKVINGGLLLDKLKQGCSSYSICPSGYGFLFRRRLSCC